MAPRTWTCQRVQGGQKCGAENPKRRQICQTCGGRRAPTKKPAHRHVLDVFPYKTWVLFFGEVCGVCGDPPKEGKKLMRDHDHFVQPGDVTQGMRGLTCVKCNRNLVGTRYGMKITPEWLEAAAAYMRRALAS